MDSLTNYPQIIETVLTEYAQLPRRNQTIQSRPVFDRAHHRYLVMNARGL